MMNSDFWEQYDMLPRGAHVLCAVSGGADSMCLLHLLRTLEAERGIRVSAAHFEHGLRGEESKQDMAFVRDVCLAWDVPLLCGQGDVRAEAARRRQGLEETARALRYAFLEQCADTLGCNRIATAHNADDNAETLLLHLVRGAGARGLSGIPPRRGRIIRPLLCCTRAEIEAYLTEHGIEHREDSSNGDLRFSRNRLRARVMPELRTLNPELSAALGRTAVLMRQDEAYLSAEAEAWLREHGDGESIPAGQWRALHPALAGRVLRLLGGNPGPEDLDRALRFAGGTERGLLELPGLKLRREQGRLYWTEESLSTFEPVCIRPGQSRELSALGLHVRAEWEDGKEIHSQFNTYRLKYESIVGDIVCTGRRPGDRFRPEGRGLSKSLKALFTEANMTRSERERALVFRDEAGILAVHPFGIDERCRCGDGEKAIRITVEKI